MGPTVTDALRLAALLPANAPALLVLVCGFFMIYAIVQVTAEQDGPISPG